MAKKLTNQEMHRISVKRKILVAANNMFAETGDINMRDLAAQMGVTTGTLYHYYKDKEDIIHELNNMADAQSTDFDQLQDIDGSVMKLWHIFTEIMVRRVLNDGVKFTKVRVTGTIKHDELKKGISASTIREYVVLA